MIKLASIAAIGLALGGCATMSEDQCRLADWSQIGFADGSKGYPRSRLAKHQEACASYGLRPDTDSYFAGRSRGIAMYCTPFRGFEIGRQGQSYHDVCPPPLAPAFLAGFNDGHLVHVAEYELESARDDRRSLEHRLEEIDQEIDDLLSGPENGEYLDRENLRDQLDSLRKERKRIRDDLRRVDARERRALGDLNRLRQSMIPVYGNW